MGFFSDIHHLPLRWLGLKNIPAVPVRLRGLLDTLLKLRARSKQVEPIVQDLTNHYTINDISATSREFLYGEKSESEATDPPASGSGDSAPTTRGTDPNILKSLSLDSPRQWSMAWSNYGGMYRHYETLVAGWADTLTNVNEASRQFWPTIAENGFAYNLLVLKKVSGADLAGLKPLFEESWASEWDGSADEGLLFVIDLSVFSTLKPAKVNGFERFTPGTITLLRQDRATKGLTPIAVRVAGHNDAGAQYFVRGEANESAWLYALQAAKTSVTVYGIWFGHVYHWHMVTAAMQMTMYNTIDRTHALYRLIAPQANYLIQFDEVLLLLWRQIAPPTSVSSACRFLRLMDTFATGRGYFEDDPLTALRNRGLEEKDFSVTSPWDAYPIVAKFLRLWQATAVYVTAFVDNTYADDDAVRDDAQLQAWMKAAASSGKGNVQGLPDVDSKSALHSVLTSLVYRITAHGGSRLRPSAYPVQTFLANFPPCLQSSSIPSPKEELSMAELLELLPKTGTIGEMMTFYNTFVFSKPYVSFIPEGGVSSGLFFPGGEKDPCNQALIEFRKALIEFIRDFEQDFAEPQFHQWPMNVET